MARGGELIVTEREFIMRLSMISGHGKDIVRDVIRAQNEFVLDELKNEIPVRLGKLGTFNIRKQVCNGGYDFGTKQLKPLKTVTIVSFKVAKDVKYAVKHANENK